MVVSAHQTSNKVGGYRLVKRVNLNRALEVEKSS